MGNTLLEKYETMTELHPKPTDAVLGTNTHKFRRTKKLTSAIDIAQNLSIPFSNPEELYTLLQKSGWDWSSDTQVWTLTDVKPPSTFLKIRLVFNSNRLPIVSEHIKSLLQGAGYEVVDVSKFYTRRPPESNDSSIYLTILPPS